MGALVKYLIAIVIFLFPWWPAAPAGDAGTWTLDDFEDGDLKGATGVSWIVIADDLVGGATEARVSLSPGRRATSRHALRLSGRLGGGTASFAGAWLSLDRSGRNMDLSAFEGVRLRVKSPVPLDVGFRSGTVNFMARIEADSEWRLVDVPFATMAPVGKASEGARWNASALQLFGVTTPQIPPAETKTAAAVAFEIDDVAFYARGAGLVTPIVSGPSTGLAVVPFTKIEAIPGTGWIDLGSDPPGDGRVPSLPDATRLEAIPSAAGDMLWVRVTLREAPHDRWMGVNLALDVDGDPANGFAWWGSNSTFKFDRLVTVWCFRVEDGCQGYIGFASAAEVGAGLFVAGDGEQLRFAIDRERRAFVVGVPRHLLHINGKEIRLVAAVGSALLYGDDVPGQGAAIIR